MMKFWLFIVTLLLPSAASLAQQRLVSEPVMTAMDRLSVERLWQHAVTLASDAFEGRGTGTPGERAAAAHIAATLKAYGCVPLGDDGSYFQHVPLHGSTPLADSRLTLVTRNGNQNLELGKDYLLYKTGAQTFIPQPLRMIFVGYGIVAPEFDYNDYQQIDVTDAIVVYVSGEPLSDDPEYFDGPAPSIHSNPELKQRIAFSRGARGSIMIPLPRVHGTYTWTDWQRIFSVEDVTLPLAIPSHMSLLLRPEVAISLFEKADYSYAAMLQLDATQRMRSFPLSTRLEFSGSFRERDFHSTNVVGLLPGRDSLLKDSYVLCVAHYDHLGIGIPVRGDSIYNGLVDNALGTAAVLELARVLSDSALRPRRPIVFLLVSAEEKGLLGSFYYTAHPAVPLFRTIACLNIDGLAIIDTFHDIVGIGAEYSTLGSHLAQVAEELQLRVSDLPPDFSLHEAFSSSDQIAFAQAGIPSLLVMESSDYINIPDQLGYDSFIEWGRRRYHTPFDDVSQPVNLAAIAQHARILVAVLFSLADSLMPPQWISGSMYINARLQSQAEER